MRIGDYVRTKKGIAKLIDKVNDPTNYFDKFWVCDRYLELNDDTEYIHEQDIIKSSSNIIDLIEEGDYVNGIFIEGNKGNYLETFDIDGEYSYLGHIEYRRIYEKDIETIVTKEQFESMEYRIGE